MAPAVLDFHRSHVFAFTDRAFRIQAITGQSHALDQAKANYGHYRRVYRQTTGATITITTTIATTDRSRG
jgi:hypothetical protein